MSQTTDQEIPREIVLSLTDDDTETTLWSAQLQYAGSTSAADEPGAVFKVESSAPSSQVRVVSETWDPEFEAIQEEAASAVDEFREKAQGVAIGAGRIAAGEVLNITKFAWDILKASRPITQVQGAFTSVLSAADPNWEHYSRAVEFTSPQFSFEGKNLFKKTMFKTKFKVQGTYRAAYDGNVKEVSRGQYLPTIFFNFQEAYAAATWSLKVRARPRGSPTSARATTSSRWCIPAQVSPRRAGSRASPRTSTLRSAALAATSQKPDRPDLGAWTGQHERRARAGPPFFEATGPPWPLCVGHGTQPPRVASGVGVSERRARAAPEYIG